jgi:hypothetical protein
VNRNAALDGRNQPLERWRRAAFLVAQLGDKNEVLKGEGIDVDAQDKVLETQHWLELIDGYVSMSICFAYAPLTKRFVDALRM